jgi:hypothetical protein
MSNVKKILSQLKDVDTNELEQLSSEEAEGVEGGSYVDIGCKTNTGCGPNTGCGGGTTTTKEA